MNDLEIERKWLLSKSALQQLTPSCSRTTSQAYLIDVDHHVLRLRIQSPMAWLTVKAPSGVAGMVREYEMALPTDIAQAFMSAHTGPAIHKTRHYVPHAQHIFEIDEFHGRLEGLIVAEMEFSSVEESHAFVPPEWLGKEVTHDIRYANMNLVKTGKIPE